MALTQEQREELSRLAKAGKMGTLTDLARQWGVDFKLVARTYNELQRDHAGAQPRTAAQPPLQELTTGQKMVIRRFAEQGNAAKLSTLAEEWNVEDRVVTQFFNECRAELLKKVQINPEPLEPIQQAPASTPADLVAQVVATPGQIAVMPRNWPLIQARLNSGYEVRDIAQAAGMGQTEYQRVEEGRLLPTPDQAAKICALLKLEVSQTFVVASQEPLFTKGAARGLSLLGILRARRRLAIKSLAAEVSEATGQPVSTGLIRTIEQGKLKQPLSTTQVKHINALAQFFGVTSEAIMAQVPPTWIQSAGESIAALHTAMKTTFTSLPAPVTDPVLAITAGNGDDLLE